MKEYTRTYPMYSLCGLNCCLCPRYHTDGASRCPGCGGADFALYHPSCSVITCSKKHDNVAFCHECRSYPCKKYKIPSDTDSFISYRKVLEGQKSAKEDLNAYLKDLGRKEEILVDLITHYNDGKLKGFYCLAVNLMPLSSMESIILKVNQDEIFRNNSKNEIAKHVKALIKEQAASLNIELKLRK